MLDWKKSPPQICIPPDYIGLKLANKMFFRESLTNSASQSFHLVGRHTVTSETRSALAEVPGAESAYKLGGGHN
jgi:hypothetical protein